MNKTNNVLKNAAKKLSFINHGKGRILFYVMAFMAVSASVAMATTGNAVGGNVQTDELEGVWEKIGSIIEGTGGKLAALGIIAVSIWNREKIGIPYMGLGIASGILLPSLPSIVNSFTFTI